MSEPAPSARVDGYDREALARCLAERGLLVPCDQIVRVESGGSRVVLTHDRGLWVSPAWIEAARRPGQPGHRDAPRTRPRAATTVDEWRDRMYAETRHDRLAATARIVLRELCYLAEASDVATADRIHAIAEVLELGIEAR